MNKDTKERLCPYVGAKNVKCIYCGLYGFCVGGIKILGKEKEK
jgi:hypothetical protein